MDCSFAAELISGTTPNISGHAFRISTIWELLRERNCNLVKINREANVASHELAKLARVQGVTHFWLGESPPEITTVLAADCIHVSD
jgi:hypothetical protein